MITLKVKNLHIQTGRTLVTVMNKKDAKKYDLHSGDRIHITRGNKSIISFIDTVNNDKLIGLGMIGLLDEVSNILNMKNNQKVKIRLEPRPASVKYIKDKMDGATLTKKQIETIIQDIVDNKLSDVELTYFIAACFSNAMGAEVYATVSTQDKRDYIESIGVKPENIMMPFMR